VVADVFSRTAVRLALGFAVLIAATVIAVFAIIYWQLSSELEQRVRLRVLENLDALSVIDSHEGFSELAEVVSAEANSPRAIENIFLLIDKDGQFIAGNVEGIPVFQGWRALKATDYKRLIGPNEVRDRYFAFWRPLSKGMLLVGGNDRDMRHVSDTLLGGLIWGLAATALLSIAIGGMLAYRAQKQIDAVSTTLAAVAQGKLDRRVPPLKGNADLNQIGAQINATLDQLQRSIERSNQISTDIAHDLKRPLGRLQQRLDTAMRSARTEAQLQAAIDASLGEIGIIVETFDALLRIAEIEAGARRLRFTMVDLQQVLMDVTEIYQAVADDAGDTFISQLAVTKGAMVLGDRELLVQLFANLIENAIRHCPKGTTIVLALREERTSIVAEVRDTGPGIPLDERDKVFHRLYRLDKSRSTPGSGLGLSLVAAIAELHNARIQLDDDSPGLRVSLRFQCGGALTNL
jgi:signal transduction histidine kinase